MQGNDEDDSRRISRAALAAQEGHLRKDLSRLRGYSGVLRRLQVKILTRSNVVLALFLIPRKEWRDSHFDAAGESFHDTCRLCACSASQEDEGRNGRIGLLPFKLRFQLPPV